MTLDDLKIIEKYYKRWKFRHKLAELPHMKEKIPSLNTQEASVPIKLLSYLIKHSVL